MAAIKNIKSYRAWKHMKDRCLNPRSHAYANYGGRGITVCAAWRDSYSNFFVDMGEPTHGLTLERRDNSRGYSPDNCYWADRKTQARNTRQAIRVSWAGCDRPLTGICDELGVSIQMVRKRLRKGWPLADALLCPSRRGAAYPYRTRISTETQTTPTR